MARTPSTMLELGTHAPHFDLPDPSGQRHALNDFGDSKGLLVMFICNHCPFVKHVREELARFGREYQEKGLAVVAINSNDFASYPDDAPDKMALESEQFGYTFPYLVDESQDVAAAYKAACTPDFFLFDENQELAYRGQLDGSRPGNGIPVTGADLRRAADSVLAGEPVEGDQYPSLGCNIKWKAGKQPSYAG